MRGYNSRQMTVKIHILMKDADDIDRILNLTVKEHVRTDRIFQVASPDVIAVSSNGWALSNDINRASNAAEVSLCLIEPPFLRGV